VQSWWIPVDLPDYKLGASRPAAARAGDTRAGIADDSVWRGEDDKLQLPERYLKSR
jgi:hypothetical protein